MNTSRIVDGDIVECRRRDRQFFAQVTGRAGARLTFVPITHNCSYYSAASRDVLRHWTPRPSRNGRHRTRVIRAGDLITLGPDEGPVYARVLAHGEGTLHIHEIGPATTPRELNVDAVTGHFARRGRRRPVA